MKAKNKGGMTDAQVKTRVILFGLCYCCSRTGVQWAGSSIAIYLAMPFSQMG